MIDDDQQDRNDKMSNTVKQAQSIVGYSKDRAANDFYPTPPKATIALLENYVFEKRIWEPACGDGAISKVLINHCHEVYSSDLYNYGYGEPGVDFLKTTSAFRHEINCDTIITNPPFKYAEHFVRWSHNIGISTLALLLKLSFLEGMERKKLFYELPPKEILVFSRRLTMTKNGEPSRNGGMIAFAWFIWEFKGKRSQPTIGWI